MSLSPSYSVRGLYIRENITPLDWIYRQEVRLRHELDHYRAAVRILEGAARTYRSFAECQVSFDRWAEKVKEMLKYTVNEVLKFFDLRRLPGF